MWHGWPFPLLLPRHCLLPSHRLCPWAQQVCVLGLHLAKELCEVDEDGDSWLQVTRRLPILPTLFTTLEVSLRMKQNLHFTEAALHLLLTLARTQQVSGRQRSGWACASGCWCRPGFSQLETPPPPRPRAGGHNDSVILSCVFSSQGATAVAGAGITQSICLPLLSVYQLSSNGTVQVSARGPPPRALWCCHWAQRLLS